VDPETLDVVLDDEEIPPAPAALAALEEAFGAPVIYAYTRRQAIADGLQFQVPADLTAEAGFRWPVFVTASVYAEAVRVPQGVEAQDETGRLWDLLMVAAWCARAGEGPGPRQFTVFVRNDNLGPQPHTFYLEAGPVDLDDAAPCLTIMAAEDL